MITQKALKNILSYSSETGIFVWLKTKRNGWVGKEAGCPNQNNYYRININGNYYLSHRLAWLYIYGEWPNGIIDHIDHDPSNNRLNNLRDVSKSGNGQNRIKADVHNKSTGLLGAWLCKTTGRYRSRIIINGIKKHLGYFDTAEDAHYAYIKAKRIFHPEGML